MQPVKSMPFSGREHGSDRPEIRRHLGRLGGAHPQRRAPRRQVEGGGPRPGGGALGDGRRDRPPDRSGEADPGAARSARARRGRRHRRAGHNGLLAMALMDLGVKARSYTGWQVKIVSDSAHNKARIVTIDQQRVRADLHAGYVVVVAGFQGVDGRDNLTTLGRGGSDTSAVALAAALKADECHIYTDVDGVYTTDPRLVPEARRLRHVTFEEMIEMAGAGSKVLQIRAVEFAGKYRVPTRVLSSLTNPALPVEEEAQSGTLITFEEDPHMAMEKAVISGVAFNRDEAKITVHDVPPSRRRVRHPRPDRRGEHRRRRHRAERRARRH